MIINATGFHAVPWDLFTANGGEDIGLPDRWWPSYNGAACDSEWSTPDDLEGETPWACSRPARHDGTHQASDHVKVLAEWRDQDANGGKP